MPSATSYKLSANVNLVAIESKSPASASILPRVILVLDCSGSMGSHTSTILNGWFPQSLIALGYDKHTPAEVIRFSDKAEEFKVMGNGALPLFPTLGALLNQRQQSGGQTNMADVFPILADLALDSLPIVIIGISDGEIQDGAICTKKAQQASRVLSSANIKVCMIRLKTSSHSQPDTRALSCLGLLDTSRNSSLHELLPSEDLKFRDILKNLITPSVTFCVEGAGLKVLPMDEWSRTLRFAHGDGPAVMLSVDNSIRVNGIAVVPTILQTLPEETLQIFCDAVQHHVRFMNVIGLDTIGICQWFTGLQNSLSEMAAGTPEPNVRTRMKLLMTQTNKTCKRLINDFLQRANDEKVASLNADQQAVYLRSTQSRDLARRTCHHAESDESLNLEWLRGKLRGIAKDDADVPSFYSASTSHEALTEFFASANEEMPILSVLRVIGYVGLPYSAEPGDYVDPYNFRVNRIFSTALSCSDLREANSHGSADNLQAPGEPGQVITGVIPLKYMQPAIWGLLPRKINEAHCSINMRKMLAPVQNDLLGERMGVLACIAREHGVGALPQWVQRIWDDVRAQLCELLPLDDFEAILAPMREGNIDNVRKSFIGGNGASCVWKPFIAVITQKIIAPDVYDALYEFDCYHAARRFYKEPSDRDKALRDIFGIEEKRVLDKCPLSDMPHFQEEKDENGEMMHVASQIREYAEWAADNIEIAFESSKVLAQRWIPNEDVYLAIAHRLGAPHGFTLNPKLKIYSIIAAIALREETDRIDKAKNALLTFNYGGQPRPEKFVDGVAKKFYSDYYEAKACEEHKIREAKHLETVVHLMASTNSFAEFLEDLVNYIPNRQHGGYLMLMRQVQDSDKLRVLLTGRDQDGRHVWGVRDFVDPDYRNYAKFFNQDEWREICAMGESCTRWRYRESDKPNSHGHSNSFPSSWALEWGKNKGR